ncbi:MAG: nodulation protein NfeD [Calditrichia bacterium]|nr:nodulation protein NfeD [Calditrichia bacterium]
MKQSVLHIFIICIFTLPLFSQSLYVVHLDGIINPVAVELVNDAIEKANIDSASVILIEMDTPGGLMKSMRMIVKEELNSNAPVIVYVSPSGSRAGSAGVFITLAAHVAAMAPGTNIGAAHPVSIGGTIDSSGVMTKKILNDAVASIRSIAKKRNRNESWAEDAVRKSASITVSEAVELNVVDFMAEDIEEVLKKTQQLQLNNPMLPELNYTSLRRVDIYKSWRQKILDFISDPTIAYMLLLIGIYGIMFEFYNPGAIFPGTLAVICLIMAFYGMQTLSVNIAGVLLILVGFVLFILEIKITSYGFLTIGGLVSFILGSVMLFNTSFPGVSIPWPVIIAAAVFTFLFMVFAVGMAIRAQAQKITTGVEGLVGQVGTAAQTFKNNQGEIYVHGEIWAARLEKFDSVKKGEQIQIVSMKGMNAIVKKLKGGE